MLRSRISIASGRYTFASSSRSISPSNLSFILSLFCVGQFANTVFERFLPGGFDLRVAFTEALAQFVRRHRDDHFGRVDDVRGRLRVDDGRRGVARSRK